MDRPNTRLSMAGREISCQAAQSDQARKSKLIKESVHLHCLASSSVFSLVLQLVLLFATSQSSHQQLINRESQPQSSSFSPRVHLHGPAGFAWPQANGDIVPSSLSNSVLLRSQASTANLFHATRQLEPSSSSQVSFTGAGEARGPLTNARNLYSQSQLLLRGARNATSPASANGPGSWHFPRFLPEQAAEVLLTGAQVINRIAQAETPLNYCRTPDNQEGECSDIRKCIWLVLDKARLKQSVCLRNLIIPAVCCPLSSANNTPIANMIQSTLEPVLFRPKPPKQRKQQHLHLKPFSSFVNKSILGAPPPSPASLIIRNPQLSQTSIPPIVSGNSSSSSSSSSNINGSTIYPTFGQNNTVLASVGTGSINYSGQAASSSLVFGAASERPSESQVLSVTSQQQVSSTAPTVVPTSTSSSTVGSVAIGSNALYQDEPIREPVQVYNRTLSQRYPWANETCGESGRTRTGRIVGGSDSKLGQWPWMTAMYLNKRVTSSSAFSSSSSGGSANSAGEFWCGGALINRRFVLTAAHCLSDQRGNRYRNDQVTIKLGGVDLARHQAPVDILRNGELETGRDAGWIGTGWRRAGQNQSRSNGREENEDQEFSWTSFITKALGLIGAGGGSSSSSNVKSISGQANEKKQLLAAHAKKVYFKEYRVANIKQHPKFQRHGFYNDIGLIELKTEVDYDDLISPVCLPSEHDLKRDMSGYMATVLGWGTLSYGGQGSKMLQQVSMPVWNNKDCDDRYLQHIGKTFLCAGFLTGGKDACQGDSGGPLMVSDKSGRWTLHGVVSFGKTCAQAGYPGVYTRVTEYLDWIRDNTDLADYTATTSTSTSSSP